MTDKVKLSIEQQIEHMESKGILFNIEDENDAKNFLTNNTYYFKLKSYCKNYDVWKTGDNKGKYKDLEYAYLKDISQIDRHMRYLILNMCLDIEHHLKIRMLQDIINSDEDGYAIIDDFFKKYPNIKRSISGKSSYSACSDLIKKHYDKFSIWVLVEILSFGDFSKLYRFTYDRLGLKGFEAELSSIKFLRNAAAHNNCLLNSLKNKYNIYDFTPTANTKSSIGQIQGIRKYMKYMNNPVINDFITLIVAYPKIVKSTASSASRWTELQAFVDRIKLNSDYYKNNIYISDTFLFIEKVIHFYGKSVFMA